MSARQVPEVEAVSATVKQEVGQVWLRLQYKFAFEAGKGIGDAAI